MLLFICHEYVICLLSVPHSGHKTGIVWPRYATSRGWAAWAAGQQHLKPDIDSKSYKVLQTSRINFPWKTIWGCTNRRFRFHHKFSLGWPQSPFIETARMEGHKITIHSRIRLLRRTPCRTSAWGSKKYSKFVRKIFWKRFCKTKYTLWGTLSVTKVTMFC